MSHLDHDTARTPPIPHLGTPPEGSGEKPFGRDILEGGRSFLHEANAALNGAAAATGLADKVQANPYGLLAAAMGAGYVAGGGLFTPTTSRLLGMAFKLAAIPVVRDRLLDLADSALDAWLPRPGDHKSKT